MKKHIVVVIDSGGRGASLVAKYSQSPYVGKILAIPGNDLMQSHSKKPVITFQHLTTTSVEDIVALCRKEKVDLVDVAQDNAVAVGLVDRLLLEGCMVVGPTKAAGELEWNKGYARDFMKQYAIAHPKYAVFESVKEGIAYLKKEKNQKWFVKAAGLAEGKGVLPAENNTEAKERILQLQQFGQAGASYVLEEWLTEKDGGVGEEFSAFIATDGKDWKLLGIAQDHKRVGNFDTGENTGGMGCVSNPLVYSKSIEKQVYEISEKTITGMRKDGRPYKGVLYIGCMVIDGKVYVIEYNARWGDPEAEVLIPGIQNDFFLLGKSIFTTNLSSIKVKVDKKIRVSVAGCAKGYPLDYSQIKGKKIFGIQEAMKIRDVHIFGAGIKKIGKEYVVNGGRVLHIVGEGKNVLRAREKVYQAISLVSIQGNNLHYRTDIGYHDVERIRTK